MIDEDGNFGISLAAFLGVALTVVKAIVYTVVTVVTAVVTGVAVNPVARENNHKKTKTGHTFEIIVSGLTKEQARGVEQIYMVHYNTRTLLNKINGISPNNKNLRVYMEAGRQVIKMLGNIVSNEALYWTGQ